MAILRMQDSKDAWHEFQEKHGHRIGRGPKEWLTWVLGAAKNDPERMTGADWENLCLELMLLSATENFGEDPGLTWTSSKGFLQPSEKIARTLLKEFKRIIEGVLRRDSSTIQFPREASGNDHLWWDPKRERFIDSRRYNREWIPRVLQCLKHLIITHGHLIKECLAPAPRGDGQACSKWFVAGRLDTKYCSPTCRSRATVRASRERAAKKNKKAKRKGSTKRRANKI